MKSQWASYQEEISNIKYFEKEFGFFAYSFPDKNTIYVEHVYVIPAERSKGRVRELMNEADRIGRAADRNQMLGLVKLNSKTCNESLRMHLALGFNPCVANADEIWLSREIPLEGN